MNNNITSARALFEEMPTSQLDAILDNELHSSSVNADIVKLILDILREREKDIQIEITPEMEIAWEKYLNDIAAIDKVVAQRNRIKKLVVHFTSSAAVLLILFTIIPQQANAESFWHKLTRWASGVVEFFSPEDNEHRIFEYEFKTDNPGLQQVYDAVIEMGITDPVVPMWLPNGYKLVEFRIDCTPAKNVLYSRFANTESEIIFTVDLYHTEVSHEYQKNESIIKTYEINDVVHYIIGNIEKLVAVWTNDYTECSISINCQEDELIKILKSIYATEAE